MASLRECRRDMTTAHTARPLCSANCGSSATLGTMRSFGFSTSFSYTQRSLESTYTTLMTNGSPSIPVPQNTLSCWHPETQRQRWAQRQ